MIATLPRPVQRQAQARSLLVSSLNPLGASITFGQVMYLLALQYGASDTAMALLYASLNITGLLALFAPRLLAGQDTSTVQARAWFARAILSLGLLALPLFASDAIKVWALVVLVYLMMGARTVGVLANVAVYKAICPPRDLAGFVGGVHARWNAGILITTALCFAVLTWQDLFPSPEWAYMALMAFGVAFNFATAGAMVGLPRTGTISGAGPLETLSALPATWRRPECREVIWLTFLQAPIGLAAAFQLNYLTSVLGMGAGTVFLLTLGGVLASILTSRVLSVVGGRISTRALWFGLHALLAAAALVWCGVETVPAASRTGVCAVMWVLSAAAIAGSTAIYASMLSERLPADDATRVSVIYQVVGVAATLFGLAALAVAKHAVAFLGLPWVHPYSHAFALWALFSAGVCVVSLRMAGGTAAVDLLAQLTPGNLSTIFRAHRLRTAERDFGPARALEREELLAAGTPAGRDLVLETLRSPDPGHRLAALRAVRTAPFPAAGQPVADEAADAASPLRVEAVTTLGFIGCRDQLPLLRRLAADPDPWIAAASCKSMIRLGEAPVPPPGERYAAAAGPRERHELLIALAVGGEAEELDRILDREQAQGAGRAWLDAVALYAAHARDGREVLHAILGAEDERPGAGLEEALALVAEHAGAEAAESARQHAAAGAWAAAAAGSPVTAADRRGLAVALTLRALEARG